MAVILVPDLLEVQETERLRLEGEPGTLEVGPGTQEEGPGTLEARERVGDQVGMGPVEEVQEDMGPVMEVVQEEMEVVAEVVEEANVTVLKQGKVQEVIVQITETKEAAEETEEESQEAEDLTTREATESLEVANQEDVQTVFWRLVLMLALEPVLRSLDHV